MLTVGMAVGRYVLAVLAVAFVAPATTQAQFKVTVAARYCPTYEAITANLARNDIQESLRDLGPNSPYTPGQSIDPDREASSQPLCRPLPNWRFTLGRGYRTRAVSGPWGNLSIVTNRFPDSIVTGDSVPLLNASGADTGRTLAGAVTIELSGEQANLASQSSRLWLEGGTPEDPVLYNPFPGQYGFGALRCAHDNLNGDNVEYIDFRLAERHVFCFAYYVTPPPDSGTIIVRKVVAGPSELAAHDFQYEGNVTFNASGRFSLTAAPGRSDEERFYRAEVQPGQTPWTVREIPQPGWELLGDLTCTSETGASGIAIPAGSGQAEIRLAASDTVTCTYRNGLTPPPSGLRVGKITRGATGRTAFNISGAALDAQATVTTTDEGVPVFESLPEAPPGDYEITETPRERDGGRWVRRNVRCNGRLQPPFSDPLRIPVPEGAGVFCLWLNEFVPNGSIRVRKITSGATATTRFTIRPVGADPPQVYHQHATTTREGAAVTATGDSTEDIQLGTYEIQELAPTGSDEGTWRLESVICNGVPYGSAQGRVRIRLTTDDPDLTCTFTNVFRRETPGQPGGGDGDEGGTGGETTTANPRTNLRITKRVVPTAIVRGQPVRYTVVVANTSRVTARNVVIDELRPPTHRRVRIQAPAGVRCRGARPLRCVIGDLPPGRRVALRATYTTPLIGRVINRVAVHTSTAETRLSDNRASATLRVYRSGDPCPKGVFRC